MRRSTNWKRTCTNLYMPQGLAPNWDDLRVFLTLAREGTLTTAAKALGVSHPTVARRVRALEKQIGARLFERLPDRFVPTSAGEKLLDDTQVMERAALAINRRSAGLSDTVSGVVRLSARIHVGPGGAAPAVAAPAAEAHRVRADGEPHARQPVAPRGRSADPRAGA